MQNFVASMCARLQLQTHDYSCKRALCSDVSAFVAAKKRMRVSFAVKESTLQQQICLSFYRTAKLVAQLQLQSELWSQSLKLVLNKAQSCLEKYHRQLSQDFTKSSLSLFLGEAQRESCCSKYLGQVGEVAQADPTAL